MSLFSGFRRARRTRKNRVAVALPPGPAGNRVLLAQLAVRLDFHATVAKLAAAHRKQMGQMGRRVRA